ncbi:MAG TPA: hypothetical protein DD490_19965 [Acidobacteria bacterium]|nr:hypothetical protein [Acidobacteriota bacterium]
MIRTDRNLLALALVLSVAAGAQAATQQAPAAAPPKRVDSCGDPGKVDQIYPTYEATVLAAVDAVTLYVQVHRSPAGTAPFPGCRPRGCKTKVRLVNLDPPKDPDVAAAARVALSRSTIRQRLTLQLSPAQETSGGISNVLVFIGTRSINQHQITAGHATYRAFSPTAVNSYLACKMERGQTQAQLAGRGVWAKR